MNRIAAAILAALLVAGLSDCASPDAAPSSAAVHTSALTESIYTKQGDKMPMDPVFDSVMNTVLNSPRFDDTEHRDFTGIDFRLGAIFWYGFSWTGEHHTDRLQQEFADRKPVWGWLDESLENMEQQVEYAAAAGLSYFAFDWYYINNTKDILYWANHEMNRAVDMFLACDNVEKMEFCLMVCNQEGALISRDNWEDAIDQWMPYLTHPQALKVDGQPVLMIHSAFRLQLMLGGIDASAACLERLRNRAVEAGLPGVKIVACESPYGSLGTRDADYNPQNFTGTVWNRILSDRKAQGLDGMTGYNYRKYSPIPTENGTTYLLEYEKHAWMHEESWKAFSDYDSLPYVPVILGGWDNRPWEVVWDRNPNGSRSCYSPDRTPVQLYNHILNCAQWMKDNPDSSLGNLAHIFAWNEYCEGGYIAPTVGDDGRWLNAVKQAVDKINSGK